MRRIGQQTNRIPQQVGKILADYHPGSLPFGATASLNYTGKVYKRRHRSTLSVRKIRGFQLGGDATSSIPSADSGSYWAWKMCLTSSTDHPRPAVQMSQAAVAILHTLPSTAAFPEHSELPTRTLSSDRQNRPSMVADRAPVSRDRGRHPHGGLVPFGVRDDVRALSAVAGG